MKFNKHYVLFIILIITSAPFSQAIAQELLDETVEPTTSINEQAISVQNQIKDDAIKQRLENIIQASQWVDNTEITVTEGIVIIQGDTDRETHRQWVESLANKTDGVIAVINQINVQKVQSWDLEPAANETKILFNKFITSLPSIVTGLLILFLTWLFAKLVAKLARKVLSKKIQNVFITNLTAKAISIPVIVIGLYLTLRLTGLTQLAVTIIGGTGLAGLIIGIAFRDIAENFLASILISLQRPFKVGDVIVINDTKGMVQTVTTRGTIMMTMDGDHVHIPNSTIYKSSIVNLTANPNTRKDFLVGIGYGDSIAQAQDIVLDILKSHEAVLNKPEYFVLVENLGASTVNLRVYFWVNNQNNSPSKVKSSIIRLTKRAFDEAGVSMPDEAREVVFPDGIHVTTSPTKSEPITAHKKSFEPLVNQSEQDLSSDDDEIKQQLKDNPLPDDSQNLLKDQL